mgnify:CR=1 FL=1
MNAAEFRQKRLSERLTHIWALLNGEVEMGHQKDPFVIDLVNKLHDCAPDAAALERLVADREAAASAAGDNIIPLDARRARQAAAPDPKHGDSGGAA